MENEKIIQLLIYSHAIFGGIALISGLLSLLSKKGKKIHKKSGKLFFYSMLLAALTALIIACLPNHESSFLFVIGIFSSYFILTGYRALRFKQENPDLQIDKIISWIMIFTATTMIFFEPIMHHKINIILAVFGIIGLIFSARDLVIFKSKEKLKKVWLKLHLGKMIGGYIAASTAFVVVNELFPSFYGWFIPGTIGGIYITYWMRKMKKQEQHSKIISQ